VTGETPAEALARLYDLDLVDDPGDLDLDLALAGRTGGPILELAVGTGRLAVPLARAGFDVTGVDKDPAMLDRARRRADATGVALVAPGPPARQRRTGAGMLDLVEADILDLHLPAAGTFRLAYIALSSLLLLATRAAQQAAFAALARHLAAGGLAVVDVSLPDAEDLARYDGRLGFEWARPEPATGALVTKLTSAQHDAARQVVTLTTIYEEGAQGQPTRRWLRTDRLRLVSADELAGLAEAAGLAVERLATGYDLEPIEAATDRIVLVAVRP
jgi:SAM-dependent methyltransferase